MKKGPALLAAACGALALAAGCGRPAPAEGPTRLLAFASIPPLQYFVQRVGGERVQVECLVQPGQEPHTYEPTPRQLAGLARARLFFLSGFPFESALVPRLQSTMPDLAIVDTRQGIVLRDMDEGSAEGRAGPDPHVWLAPLLARRQAQTIRDALVSADPGAAAAYQVNYERFAAELEEAHRELARALAPLAGRELLVYHPAFGYFAAEFGLRQVAVQMGGKEPTARQLADLVRTAREHGVRVVFVQPQFSQAGARAVAEAIGGAVVPLDDLPSDYLANLRDMSRKVREALSDRGATP